LLASQYKKYLRTMDQHDLDIVLHWRNHPTIRDFMLTQHKISQDEHRNWFQKASISPDIKLLIFEIDSIPLGFLNFTKKAESFVADWGFYVSPDAPKGTGTQLGHAGLEYGFAELHLHKLCGQALSYNLNSIRFHKKLGFLQEGLLREQYCDGQQYHDILHFGFLASEWELNQ